MNLQRWLLCLKVIYEEGPPHTTAFSGSPISDPERSWKWIQTNSAHNQTASLGKRSLVASKATLILNTHLAHLEKKNWSVLRVNWCHLDRRDECWGYLWVTSLANDYQGIVRRKEPITALGEMFDPAGSTLYCCSGKSPLPLIPLYPSNIMHWHKKTA